MARFKDVYLDRRVPSYPLSASPRWSTDIIVVDSGAEAANQKWSQPLYRFNIPEAIRSMEVYETVHAHWMIMAGPAYTFPFRNPFDFASRSISAPSLVPTITPNDVTIGIGDGAKTTFQIIKTYTRGIYIHNKNIRLPVVNTVRVAIGNVEQVTGWTVDRLTGIITFAAPPVNGASVTCGYLYDTNVRFESDDSFDSISQNYGVAGYSDLTLIEVPMC